MKQDAQSDSFKVYLFPFPLCRTELTISIVLLSILVWLRVLVSTFLYSGQMVCVVLLTLYTYDTQQRLLSIDGHSSVVKFFFFIATPRCPTAMCHVLMVNLVGFFSSGTHLQ